MAEGAAACRRFETYFLDEAMDYSVLFRLGCVCFLLGLVSSPGYARQASLDGRAAQAGGLDRAWQTEEAAPGFGLARGNAIGVHAVEGGFTASTTFALNATIPCFVHFRPDW